MSVPIQLSLAGDGRLVILTPATVRKAFFQFSKVNPEYTGREKYRLDYPLYNPVKLLYRPPQVYWWKHHVENEKERELTLLDALHRPNIDSDNHILDSDENFLYLHPQDIQRVERQINKYILNHDLALVEDEGRVLDGYGICKQPGKNREKVKYIRRYGMFFILEPISLQIVIKMRNVDLFIQDIETYDFHLVRYQGILLSSLKSRIKLSFCHRLDFSRTGTWTLDQFRPRQIFLVKQIYPCPGFCLINSGLK
jgi:hypothetical protein